MLSTTDPDTVDTTPKQSSKQNNNHYVDTKTPTAITITPTHLRRSGSPLKQEVLASPVPESPVDYYYSPSASPTFSRDARGIEGAHRWTVLSREAEADEVSILSVTSEEKNYFAALIPDALQTPENERRTSSRISGFSGAAVAEDEYEYNNLQNGNEREDSVERFSEVEYDESPPEEIQESVDEQFPPPENEPTLPPFTVNPPLDPPPYVPIRTLKLTMHYRDNKNYVFYPLPIPKKLILPPRLTGPNATKDLPSMPTFKPPKERATDTFEQFLNSHKTALAEDPHIVLQTEFDENTLMGTLMNNLRDQKSDQKSRARTNLAYVPGGKSLLEQDQEVVRRMQMGKVLAAKGGRNWGSTNTGSSRTGSPRQRGSGSRSGSGFVDDDEIFESVSLADMEYQEEDEDVPLAMVRNRIVTQRQDAEESLVERMKRLKEERRLREIKDGETLMERMARLKMENTETLAERQARLKMQRMGMY